MKDVKWAKEKLKEVLDLKIPKDRPFDKGYQNGVSNSLDILNQIDKIEILSQEWIDEHSYNIEEYWQVADMTNKPQYVVSVENIQKILVPKQEITKEQAWEVIGKPTIPQYVADLLEEYKSQEPEITFYGFIKSVAGIGFRDNQSKEGKFTRWLANKNENVVMKAWLAYPNIEIEKEPLK